MMSKLYCEIKNLELATKICTSYRATYTDCSNLTIQHDPTLL